MKKSKISFAVYPKTIYSNVVSMPDPMLIGVTIHYYNFHTSALYMKIFASGDGFSSNSVELGSLGAGANAYRNLDNLSSISKPASELTQYLHLILKGYTDAAYTDEFASFSRDVTVVFIKSDDGSWTLDEDDNFDDGTVQGWAVTHEYGSNRAGYPTIAAAIDYVLSSSYSCKITQAQPNSPALYQLRARLAKTFATPNKNFIYAILNVRQATAQFSDTYGTRLKNLQIQQDSTVLVYLGRPYDQIHTDYVPVNKWMRIIVPLPKNVSVDVRIVQEVWMNTASAANYAYLWLDDFKIISKD